MLTGKSPSSSCRPAGRIDHWLCNKTEPPACAPGKAGLVLAGRSTFSCAAALSMQIKGTKIDRHRKSVMDSPFLSVLTSAWRDRRSVVILWVTGTHWEY